MKKNNVSFSAWIFIFIIPFLPSCMPTILELNTSCSKFKNKDFDIAQIENQRAIILPILSASDKEQVRQEVGRELSETLENQYGRDKILSANITLGRLNEAGLIQNYATNIRDYRETGILSRTHLNDIKKATDARYAFYNRIMNESEISYLPQMGTMNSRNAGLFNRLRIDEVKIESQVWDLNSGEVVWEGFGGYAVNQNRKAASEESIVKNAVVGLSNVIGQNKQSLCPNKSDLYDAEYKAASDSYTAAIIIPTIIGGLLSLLLLPTF